MKKILSILGAVSLTAAGASGVIANKPDIGILSKKIWKKKLNLEGIEGLYDYNCVSTSVQMILNYYNIDINTYTQDRIHSDLRGRPGFGVMVSQATATYINNTIRQQNIYYYNQLGAGYGSNENELRLFQQYVVNSISLNAPLFFSYDPFSGDAHATVIYGINIDENPRNTQYYIMDPSDGRSITINGRNLSTFLALGGDIIGISNNFDFKNKRIKMEIKEDTHIRNRLYSGDDVQLNKNLNLDLATVGIMSHNQLNKANSITFPDLTLNENWNGKEENYSGDSWNAKNITGNQEWVEWKAWEYYHDYFLARARLWWWDSTKIIEETSNNFIVAFQYNFNCLTLGSSSSIDVTLDYGKVVYINF